MTPFHMEGSDQKIHPSQAVWQIFEIGMNAWILVVMLTVGITLPLVIWTMFEVAMNAWILFTMTKVGISRKSKDPVIEMEPIDPKTPVEFSCGHGFELSGEFTGDCILCDFES